MNAFRSLDDADVKGKRVLLRVDLNVPMQDGKVADATRIEEIAPTITELADKGGKVILLSHLNRPKGFDPKDLLKPVAAEVARIVKRPVAFAEDCIGPKAEAAIARMKNGDILCLENTRFHPEEEKNDKAFAKKLAALGDLFVDDAFSVAHREHAANTAIVTVSNLPAYPGRAMKAELDALQKAFETPQHPVAAIVGGAKISTKLDLLGHLLSKVETLIIGGGMANTFLAAQGKPIGKSLCENDLIPNARDILAKAKALKREIVLPVDVVVAQKLAAHVPTRVVAIDRRRRNRHDLGHRPAQHRTGDLGAGPLQDPGLERPVRRLRGGTVRHRNRRGGGSGGGTHGSEKACQFCRRRRHRGGAQCGGRHGPPDPCLDRRRRLFGVARRQDPAGGGSALDPRDIRGRRRIE